MGRQLKSQQRRLAAQLLLSRGRELFGERGKQRPTLPPELSPTTKEPVLPFVQLPEWIESENQEVQP